MRVVKISPGKNAEFWTDCLQNAHICVGFRQSGDLRRFGSPKEVQARINEERYDGKAPGAAAKVATQLWVLRHLEPGDRVIASKGNSVVLSVGIVTGPYRWDASHHHHHVVPVDWATSERLQIAPQREWNNNTVADVPAELFTLIARRLPNGDMAAEVMDALESAKERGSGQGFSGSPQVRKALERHAVSRAMEYFGCRGFDIKPEGKPYDLCCTRRHKQLFVEVKGTQGSWEKVILTRNEVSFARRKRKQMVLFVVHHIDISGDPERPQASAGTPHILRPWDVDAGRLDPPAYEYYLPH